MSAAPIYLNNAGTSWPKAPGVRAVVEQVLSADPREYASIFEAARKRVARCLGVEEPDALVFTPGCTSALATTLHAVPWQGGDVVVTSSMEHQAVLSPIARLVATAGVVHRTIDYAPGDPFCLDQFEKVAATGVVRLVVVTAASNVTGERLPVTEITRIARMYGIASVVDAAQVAGLVDLDVPTLGADVVAFAGHKGPLAPQGIGGLWAAPSFQPRPGYCDVGSVDLPGAAALANGLEWLASSAAPPRAEPIHLRARLFEELKRRPGCKVFGAGAHTTATLSFVHDRLPVDRAEAFFASRGIVVRAGRHCAPQALRTLGVGQGTIRLSLGPFNSAADVDAVFAALDAIGRA